MAAQKMDENDASLDKLFRLTMKKQWKDVESFYTTNEWSQKTKLTKYGDTALHKIVSNYHPQSEVHDANIVNKMLDSISEDEVYNVLSMKNSRGNTPLHLAATFGWVEICQSIALKDPELVKERNKNGETPLFAAACHGQTEAFICLNNILTYWKERQPQREEDENSNKSLCRRKSDGNTALHLAITGAYFELAYQIIEYIPELVDSKNVDGESPIHILAKTPRLFKSGSHMGLYDSIIYHSITIKELTQQRHILRDNQTVISPTSGAHYPENYQTCVTIFRLLWNLIYKTYQAVFRRYTRNIEHGGWNDAESPRTTRNESYKEKSRVQSYFPANYATAILLFEFAIKVISSVFLGVLGIGFRRIKKIQDNKKRYSQALQIMNIMIDFESGYKYNDDGEKPQEKLEHDYLVQFRTPASRPPVSPDERDVPQSSIETNSGITSSNDVQNNPGKERGQVKSEKNAIRGKVRSTGTPLLVAASMGIPEMVQKILSTCPAAIHDLDSDGKNALLLAVENKQPTVFDLLLQTTEDMFHQVDNQGNSILYLAAMMGSSLPWRIPGAALQMQWELKWYKHVKRSIYPPYNLAPENLGGHTPRQVFTEEHKKLVEEGTKWLIKTSESCSLVAALIATVAFATSTTVPGGLDDKTGRPILTGHKEFDTFSISSLIALCLSVTALVYFLTIISSRSQERDFKENLLGKLFYGLTSLLFSIAAILVSFCAGHSFILRDELRIVAVPIYVFAGVPVTLFLYAQLPLYFDLLQASHGKVPLRSFKAF